MAIKDIIKRTTRDNGDFEIPKEIFDRAETRQYGYGEPVKIITIADRKLLFEEAILYGYGLHHANAYEKDGKYFCNWDRYAFCD